MWYKHLSISTTWFGFLISSTFTKSCRINSRIVLVGNYASVQTVEINLSSATNKMFMRELHFCVGGGERKWSLDLCVFRYASPRDGREGMQHRGGGKERNGSGMSELFSVAESIASLSMQLLPLRRCSFSPSLIPASVGRKSAFAWKVAIRLSRTILRFVPEAPSRISSDAAAINVRELNRWSREKKNASWRSCKVYAREVKKRYW